MSEYEKSSESATESEGAMMAICQVCDFLGANSHFGTLTCRACAEFFRRSIHQSRDYKCRYEAEEEGITMPREKVKHCRHCRLQKCHAIGMRADAVDSRLLARRRRKKTTCLAISPEFIPFKQDQQIQAVQSLCYVIEKFQRLYFRRDFPTAILAKAFSFGNLREILEWTDKLNLIGGGMPPPHHQSIENVQILGREKEQAYTVASCYQCRNGTANFCMTQSLLVLFDLVKTISAFHQIGMDDKIFHLSSIGMPFLMFCYYFHSCQLNIGAMLNRDGTPVMPIFKEEKYAGDKTVENITEYMFVRAFKRFHQSGLVKEEWVLLKAILLTQPVSFNLSSHAQLLLQSESEKYATMFLRLLQQRLGHMAGASRYSELLGLIQLAYNSARRNHTAGIGLLLHARQFVQYFLTSLDDGHPFGCASFYSHGNAFYANATILIFCDKADHSRLCTSHLYDRRLLKDTFSIAVLTTRSLALSSHFSVEYNVKIHCE